MLEALDEQIFATLEDAYGPAVDTPARLRAIAGDSLADARAALEELTAGIFHQGSYFSATAPTVPFLIELAAAPIVARANVRRCATGLAASSLGPRCPRARAWTSSRRWSSAASARASSRSSSLATSTRPPTTA